MLYVFVGLLHVCMTFSAIAMEEGDLRKAAILPWVESETSVLVTSLKIHQQVSIDNTTTIGDIKSSICDYEGVPVSLQHLRAKSIAWIFWTEFSGFLANDENVKEVMSKYNTRHFTLCLKLPDGPQ